ncbi:MULTISPECIES: nucleotide sugar dehydrogenase [Clostridium]|jgi:UDP-N-acetyl-D-glucosamine dehydrogenase|uniref:UDP-N-acetyl-D-glucosamine 6-dehydrogenase WbpA n=1 Tax=Clostridium saccharoperbutylacetonicum N1-4(HMT) TaxID=931276 RepID=M1N7E3_9CLOT|nr:MULTISPECIES: nucleotide sugar dehydrogenase [Clostridium]AGF59282.1 UDP-N-acetyl-D-glucosamine 6-dehydrogenase WbpA [Clostridium saccharoperbutylacetonicum N1-4(HMT)]AQR97953.1 UDP-N-acetyl-D-glucosamine 6-dehydrogenase [Clostridium saccharoperbutylacetonicum]NRT59930.1 UDP-N-acetyl-D-glucosamine dehydrogenase [Clostridium saccharoperbutylacetonicum]NSB23242.1 UDP-N-acetyl-D-glucosamine dehydrogenase [Clostridium saccharoperbutylacetonicum]NSB33846.1 UDP-N-acetyl-D-glucosamine dehydrogenas
MSALKQQLLDKINNKTAKVGVVGLGYVGLPLAVEKANAGYKTIGFDVQEQKVKMVNDGQNYIGDVVDETLKKLVEAKTLQATTDFSFVKDVDTICICVPTPLDLYKQPDLSYVVDSTKSVAQYLHKGMLVILESTTYPGTTEEVLKPILEESGLKCGEDFFLAFSPERVDPGNKDFNTKNTPKVVGGCSEECTEVAAALYRNILEGDIHTVSSPAVAEMEKILENTFRNINIGLANEMAILCNRMGIDVWEVIDAAKTKPYGFMPFYPGPGLGGHCIPLDPFYLEWKAKEYDYHTRLIETSGEINDSMPEFVLDNVMKILNKNKKALNGAKVLLLGVAYKNDIDDYRESPAFKVIELLEKNGADLKVNDPYCAVSKYKGKIYNSVDWKEVIDDSDIVIITTNHSCYDYESIVARAKVVYDTRNATKNVINNREKIYKL